MIKYVLAALLITTVAHAQVGDTITHSLDYMGAQGSITNTITAYDANSATYKVKTDVNVAGQSQTSYDDLAQDDVMTKAKIQIILANCAQFGGTIERVGQLNTCKLAASQIRGTRLENQIKMMNADFIWMGQVPVNGIVKAISNGVTIVVKSYHWAQ